MTTSFSASSEFPGSATIYKFPPRGRFALRDRSEAFAQEFAPAANVQLPRGVTLVTGSGWYHDAAIQDANHDANQEQSRNS